MAIGDVAEADCGSAPPIFSPSGMFVACGGQLVQWPTLTEVARLGGIPIGWGDLDGHESLLVQSSQGAALTVLDTFGNQQEIDVKGLEGRVNATWSPKGDAIWLQSGVQTRALRLDAWTSAGRVEIGSVPNQIGATNITANTGESWIAVWGSSCATGTNTSSCQLTLAVAQAGASSLTPMAAEASGLIAAVWVTDDGTVLFTVPDEAGHFDLWRARQGEAASLWRPKASLWPLTGSKLALADGDRATIVDLATGQELALTLPAGIEPSALVSVAPDATWFAAESAGSIAFQPLEASGETRPEVSLQSLAGVSVLWAGDDRYAAVFVGPPPTTIVVRLK
jgi:hypothetical protein